jgi:tripartite-type tricarboxylate transporter receptor subunit TctC
MARSSSASILNALLRVFVSFVVRLCTAAALFAAAGAWAQSYPAKTVRVIVPFAPGGFVDFSARIVVPRLAEALGVAVVIENRGGAGGVTGSDAVAKAAPDGYTVLVTSISHTINLSVNKTMPYDTRRDFTAVTQIADAPNLLVVHPSLPARSVKELIGLARARPGAITYASSGSGTSTHISAELFKALTKTDLVHVPYKGGGPAVVDLMGGHVQTMFSTMPTVVLHVKTGRLRALAVTGDRRFPGTPEIPTVAEAGVPGYEVSGWTGMFLPAATPREAASRLAEETARVLNAPGMNDRFLVQGALPRARALDSFGAFVESEIVKWKKVVDFSGARAE